MRWNEIEYDQISGDWRHRDNLTWQIPSVIVTIGGALIAAAFSLNLKPCIKSILLGFGAFLSFCLTFALAQNLWYQMGSGEALKKITSGQGNTIKKEKVRRTLSPKDFNISICGFIKQLFVKLTGSALLFILCFLVTIALFVLFIGTLLYKW